MLGAHLMEPLSNRKRRLFSEIVRDPKKRSQPTLDDLKEKLRVIRTYSLNHLDTLIADLRSSLNQCPDVEIAFPHNGGQALKAITGISCGSKILVNRSTVVINELMGPLVASGCEVVESYYDEFKLSSQKLNDFGHFFSMPFEARFESFDQLVDLAVSRRESIQGNGAKDFIGLIGVNAICADNGSIVLLQHMNNIRKVFEQAKEIILIVGLDKIVKTSEDAIFQTKCMGVAGSEALPAAIRTMARRESGLNIDALPFDILPEQVSSKIHIILLDNDRTSLVNSQFKDLFLCIGCRACNGFCPATLSGKPLLPRDFIAKFKKYLPQVGPGLLDGDAEIFPAGGGQGEARERIAEDEIWACTTCGACQDVCPVELKPIDAIVGLRQNLVMISTSNPSSKAAGNPLRNLEIRGHPWIGINLAREAWTEGIDVKIVSKSSEMEILYWVGCTGALDDRTMKVPRAMGRLMKSAGINFGILGAEESCCGDPARRLGNEYLFQLQVERNISMLHGYNVKKIVTGCPHCYNMIKNEYPRFGGEFEVLHHTELMAQLLKEGRLRLDGGIECAHKVITYHDPCYLGRYNSIYQPPRDVLKSIRGSTIIDMQHNRDRSFCCGGGGGRMWLEEHIGQRMSELRVEQARDTKATTIGTACPFCLQMIEDAVKAKGVQISVGVMDLAELLIPLEVIA